MSEKFHILKGRKRLSQELYSLYARLGIIPAQTMNHAPGGIVQFTHTAPAVDFEWCRPAERLEITVSELSGLLDWARCERDKWQDVSGGEGNHSLALVMIQLLEDELKIK